MQFYIMQTLLNQCSEMHKVVIQRSKNQEMITQKVRTTLTFWREGGKNKEKGA